MSEKTTAMAIKAEQAEPSFVTADQLDLVKRTVAKDATDDELKLYLYDCRRQGVHPLDKLIHFTKRGGKYTPVTSIDFMRMRAADSGEYAGSEDALFGDLLENRYPEKATVTVWRLVQGQRCPFTATARWSEYKPEGQAFMWLRMPHTMIAKCAEALALRKGFPRQLAGLYAKEELDQAQMDPPEKKARPGASSRQEAGIAPASPFPERTTSSEAWKEPSVPNGADSGPLPPDVPVDLKPGHHGKAGEVVLSTGEALAYYKQGFTPIVEHAIANKLALAIERKESAHGVTYATKIALKETPADSMAF